MASASWKIIDDYFRILTSPPQDKGFDTGVNFNIFDATKLVEGQSDTSLFSIAKADDVDDPMITSLSGHSLNDSTALEYVALSYVYGDPTLSDHIECNSYQMHITHNLSLALRTIRKLNYHLVWID